MDSSTTPSSTGVMTLYPGSRGRMLRSDRAWHSFRVVCPAPPTDDGQPRHIVVFLGASGEVIGPAVPFQVLHPSRRVQWYDAAGALQAEGRPPPAVTEDDIVPPTLPPPLEPSPTPRPAVLSGAPLTDGSLPTVTLADGIECRCSTQLAGGGGVVVALSSGQRWVKDGDTLLPIVLPRVPASLLPAGSTSPKYAAPLRPPEGGWLSVAAAADAAKLDGGCGVLWRRVRVFWPLDGEWFSGRVTGYNKETGEQCVRWWWWWGVCAATAKGFISPPFPSSSLVHYDDSEERWLVFKSRSIDIQPEYAGEVVGRTVVIKVERRTPLALSPPPASPAPEASTTSDGSTTTPTPPAPLVFERVQHGWCVARVVRYLPELDMHELRFEDGVAEVASLTGCVGWLACAQLTHRTVHILYSLTPFPPQAAIHVHRHAARHPQRVDRAATHRVHAVHTAHPLDDIPADIPHL